jgi:oligopeptide transport system permease protein
VTEAKSDALPEAQLRAQSSELSAAFRVDASTTQSTRKHRTLWGDAVRRFTRNRLAVFGLVVVFAFVFVAIFADVIAPYPYDKADFSKVRLLPMRDAAHPLGTDEVGRDYLSRLMYGARTSLTVAIVVMSIAVSIGVPLGGLAGYYGGKVDFVVLRLIEIMTAFPGLLFSILVITLFGGGMWMVIFAISVTSWIGIARLTRSQILSLREKEFIESARAMGLTQRAIIFRHLVPNAISPIIVAVTFGIPTVMFAEAGLSFLGIGINDPIPSWGKMVGISSAYVRVSWHMALFPTLAIALAMLGFSFIGDGLRDALDPKMTR